MFAVIICFVLLLVLILIAVSIFHKVRKIHLVTYKLDVAIDDIRREAQSLFSQIQAYQDLTRHLHLERSLPRLRGWAASPDFLLAVAEHALYDKPVTCLECSSGASTIVLARCMQLNGGGHVFSLEHDPYYAQRTRNALSQHGLEAWATIVEAPLIDISGKPGHKWYSLANLPAIESPELLIIDGPPHDTCPMARYPALPLLEPMLARRAVVFLDDADRPEEQAAVRRWLEEIPGWSLERIDCEKGCARLTRE